MFFNLKYNQRFSYSFTQAHMLFGEFSPNKANLKQLDLLSKFISHFCLRSLQIINAKISGLRH